MRISNIFIKGHVLTIGLWLLLFIVPYVSNGADKLQAITEDTVTTTTDDEFGEFKEFNNNSESGNADSSANCSFSQGCGKCPNNPDNAVKDEIFTSAFWWVFGILCATILAGFLVRNKFTRRFRIPFLLASIVFLGVYKGTCPCMISSFENTVLVFAGVEVNWINLLWFLGLIPITYIFGRVFCGWICHLGALQEFLFRPGKWTVFTGDRSVKVMKIIQYVLFVALVIQLVVQQKIFWCKIDPFLAIYQIMLAYNFEILSGILIGLLLVTSLISYRPFCRSACPVGLMLGWIEKIPGASVIGLSGNCINCTQCRKACNINAIYSKGKEYILNNEECIACGECLDACKKTGLSFFRRSKVHRSKINLCKNSGFCNNLNCL